MTQIKNDILAEADRIINGERQEQYGKPEDSFAKIAYYWNNYINNKIQKVLEEDGDPDCNGKSWIYEEIITPHDVAMMMIMLKVARTESGNKKKDNYVDICGYAALAADL